MKKVRAKFWCMKATPSVSGDHLTDYELSAVYDGSEENKRFWEATPAGTLVMSAMIPSLFEEGKEYYLDFTEAPKE